MVARASMPEGHGCKGKHAGGQACRRASMPEGHGCKGKHAGVHTAQSAVWGCGSTSAWCTCSGLSSARER